ncbi:LysM peptidoglycan-binding domain-containing protein [Streptococcus mitis]|uniref:LysM peptidoglycan-binding domain-containing protein n=1 Tax=Streptococcus mitis TaxID=28037 RepID=UPI00398C2325
MRQTNVRGSLSLRGFRKLRTGAIVATGVILLGLGFLAPTVSASEQDGVWVARTVEEVKADIQNIDNLSHYTIKWGDTLSAISGATGLSVDSLVEINRIANRDLIFANNKLYFSEEAFLKDGNTEVKRQRVSIENSGSRQSYEVETKTDTVTGEQRTTVKQTTPVAVETPAETAPKAEPQAAETTPKADEPATPAPKVEEPATPAPQAEEPMVSEPKAEEPAAPAPQADEPVSPAPKVEEPATPAPKADEPVTPAPKVEDPTVSEPKAEEPAAPAPKAEEPMVSEPKAEEPVSPAPKVEEPEASAEPTETAPVVEEGTSGEQDQPAEETPAPSKPETPSSTEEIAKEAERTEPEVAKPTEPKEAESTTEGASTGTVESAPASTESAANGAEGTEGVTPKVEKTAPAGEEGKSEPTESAPKVEAPAETAEPKGTEPEVAKPATPKEEGTTAEAGTEVNPTAKEDAPEGTVSEGTTEKEKSEQASNEAGTTPEAEAKETEEEKLLEETKQDSIRENIDEVVNIKLAEIEKIENSDEKIKLKAKLDELRKNAVDAIKNAKDEEEALELTEKHQNIINSLEISGEKYTKPNYDKDNLSTGRNDGITIEGGSTAIGHGSGEAPSGATQPAPAEGTDNSSATTSSTQPATGTNSDSTGTAQPQPAVTSPASSAQPTNESSASTGAATESPAPTQPVSTETTSDSAPTAKPQPVATSETETSGTSSFRRAGEYQARARRTTRSVNQPDGTVNISYMYDEMPDIHGFLSDPGEDNTVTIPAGTSEAQAKELVKEKIQAKIKDLAARGYHVKNDIIFEQDTDVKNFNYVVTFTKETTGTTGFRIAPKVQVRAKKVVKRDLSNKTKHINVYYNLTSLKDIAGALGELGGENVLTFSGETSKEELKRAVEEKTKAQIEKLKKQGFTVTSTTDLDQIVEGGDSYDYVVEFTKESKAQPVGTTGFRKAPLVQRRAKRSTEVKETVNVNIYFNLKTLPGIAGALDVDGETTIKLPKNASEEEVKEAIKAKIAKVENRGYKVNDFYFGAKTEKGYDYVVEFTK